MNTSNLEPEQLLGLDETIELLVEAAILVRAKNWDHAEAKVYEARQKVNLVRVAQLVIDLSYFVWLQGTDASLPSNPSTSCMDITLCCQCFPDTINGVILTLWQPY